MDTIRRGTSMMLLGAALVLASVLFLMAAPATAHADTGQQVLNEANQAAGKNAFSLIEGGELLNSMEQATQAGFASADTVVLVTSEGYWDGVAAMSLAGAQNAPVLFVYKDGVPGQTASEIRRLGATNAIIVGNTESVGAAVEEQLGTLGLNVRRLAGASYADTANAVAQALGEAASNTCLIASGNGYWDCMCATSYSYATNSPVFFASDNISPATLNAVKAGGYSQAVILGGPAVVRDNVVTQLKDLGLNVRRLMGPSAYETAVSFANWALEQGMTVNNMAVADISGYLTGTLAGPLAGKANSVVLYGANPGGSLHTSTADFIKKQAAQINSGYVLGAIANPNWNPTPKTPWQDMSGETAVDTMASIVQAGWQDNCGGTVIVSNISGYWDALAASALAGATGAPVLLTDGTALSPQARAEINRIKPSSIYIVGGTAVVSNGVEAELRTLAPNLERFAGENAILTAEAICAKVNELKKAKTCIVATVNGFYDSLSIAPGAFALNMPIYLTASDNKLAATTMQAIKAAGYQNAVIVGGHAAVSPAVEKQLQDSGVGEVKRLSGENAWQTSAAIAEWELSQGMQADNMGVADGNGFWDALSGAALCGKNNAILILVPHDDGVFAYDPYCINKIVKPNAHKIKKSCVFGGLAVIPQATRDALSAALG